MKTTMYILLEMGPAPDWIPVLCGAVIAIIAYVLIIRWVFQIDTIVKNQEKQLRTTEETVIQNEKIIKLLQTIAGETKPQP